jgi:hypothetical protein
MRPVPSFPTTGGTSMRSLRSERGAISVGLIVAIVLALFLAYEAKQFGPLLMAQFEFQDAVMEATKFSANKPADKVQLEIVKKANELALPITREMVVVTRQPTNTRVQISYELAAEWLPGKQYKWQVNIDEQSVLF